MPRSKRTKACDISQKVRKLVKERDGNICVFCSKYVAYPQICHYISRGSGGLGIPENLVCGCVECHEKADKGTHTTKEKAKARKYLMSIYPDWDESKLKYKKDAWLYE